MKKIEHADLKRLSTYSIEERKSKVHQEDLGEAFSGGSFSEFIDSLPKINAANDIQNLAKAVVKARRENKPVILGMGAHVIKCGLSPIINRLINDGIITCVATNGACMVHDFELAYSGMTSEIVDDAIKDGSFGMARETGDFINNAINTGVESGLGLGKSLGKKIYEQNLKYRTKSIFAAAYKKDIPITVHVAVGTDIIHLHPDCDGSKIGQGSHRDFMSFSSVVSNLEGGVYINLGSAVILPEIFLKAITLVRNLGYSFKNVVTANLDFIQHYRPSTNVIRRPTSLGGKGYQITGHHEILMPLLTGLIYQNMGS